MPGNRQQWFEKLDQPVLSPLPQYAYQYTDIKNARVDIDYHLIYDQHLYSVPHHCVGEQVELHAGDKLIEGIAPACPSRPPGRRLATSQFF